MNFWIAADFHFGHKKMFEDGYEQKILKALSKIPDTDTLIFLGDFCICDDEKWHYELCRFWFRKWMIRGGLDKKSISWYLEHGWDVVCEVLRFEIYGKDIYFSHFPVNISPGVINIFACIQSELRTGYGGDILAMEYPQTLRSLLKKSSSCEGG